MIFDDIVLARSADDVDLSSVTTATRTGPAAWVAPGSLEIPFSRALTDSEVAAVRQLLTAPTDAVAQWRAQVSDFLAIPSPTPAQTTAAFQNLVRLTLDLLDRTK